MGTAVAAPEVAALAGEERETVIIGGLTFYQEELGIEQAANVAASVMELFSEATQSGALDTTAVEKIDTNDLSTVWPVLRNLAASLPKLLGDVFSAVLTDADGEPLDDEAKLVVRKRLKLRQAMTMVKTFVRQNDLPDVVASFISTRDAVSEGIKEMQASGSTPTAEKS